MRWLGERLVLGWHLCVLHQSDSKQHRWCRSVGDRDWAAVPAVADDIGVRDVRQGRRDRGLVGVVGQLVCVRGDKGGDARSVERGCQCVWCLWCVCGVWCVAMLGDLWSRTNVAGEQEWSL